MGFFDDLMSTIQREQNDKDPLFGGLVPRQQQPEFAQQVMRPQQQQVSRGSMPRPGGQDRLMPPSINSTDDIHGGRLKTYNPLATRNLVYNWDEQKINVAKDSQRLDREKLNLTREKDSRDFGLDLRKQGHTEDVDAGKQDIEHRKLALDQWKAANPEGEIKIAEDGSMHVIDKRTGASINTGLKGEHFSDKEKSELAHKHAIDLENLRQSGRKEIETMRDTSTNKLITPTQQRAAERDVANELLNDNRYSWLKETGIISANPDGSMNIKDPANFEKEVKALGGDRDKAKGTIDFFLKEMKQKANERMGRSVGGSSSSTYNVSQSGMVSIRTDKGDIIEVPEDDVDEAIELGGSLVDGTTETKPKGDNNFEKVRDSAGKLVYAGNVKGKR